VEHETKFLAGYDDELQDEPLEIWTTEELAFEQEEDARAIRLTNRASSDGRPEITLKGNNLPAVIGQIDDALIKGNAPIYQRSGTLVRIGETVITKNKSGLEFVNIVPDDLVVLLSRYINWARYDGRQKQFVNVNCPLAVAKAYLSQRGTWKIPTVHAIITAPMLRSDGSILDQPGLDPKTGIYYDPRGIAFPSIPIRPTQADAREALDRLIEFVGEVPFVRDDDGTSVSRAVFLSAVLTALFRPALPAAPMHTFSAPSAGNGKSMLVSAISILATGEPACVLAQGFTEEETEKRLATVLRAGDQVVSFDNCTRPIEGELLCQAITEPTLSIRILGKSERTRIANTAFYAATGNNLVVAGDMVRRTLRCIIDAEAESPENRTFQTERPDKLAARQRAELVVAGLTVLRAFFVAGCPQTQTPLGSLEEWSRTVREALIWLGEPDPCRSIEGIRQEDPERVKVANVLREWYAICDSKPMRVRELIDVALTMTEFYNGQPPKPRNPGLREALIAVADNGIGKLNKQAVANWIGKHKNKIIDGYKVVEAGKLNGYPRWRVIGPDEPDNVPRLDRELFG
jgi:putative DNA primase/helicase